MDKIAKLTTSMRQATDHRIRVTAYFEQDLIDAVDNYGKSIGMKRSSAVRRAVLLGLQTDGIDVEKQQEET